MSKLTKYIIKRYNNQKRMRLGDFTMNIDELLDVSKVASELGVHVDTVRKWIREKKLPAVDLGRRGGYRIRRSALEEFLRKRETIQDDNELPHLD